MICEIQEKDVDQVTQVIKECDLTYLQWAPCVRSPDPSHWQKCFARPDWRFRISVQDDTLAGVLGWYVRSGRVYLSHLFVRPSCWGKGVAQELMEWFEEDVQSRGYTSAQLRTHALNGRARNFYARQGWRFAGVAPSWQGLEMVFYTKEWE